LPLCARTGSLIVVGSILGPEGRCVALDRQAIMGVAGCRSHVGSANGERRGGASTDRRATNMWARRVLIGSGLAVASLIAVPSVAGVAGAATCPPTTIASMTTPTSLPTSPTTTPTSGCSTPPVVSGTDGNVSLPNTATPGKVVPVSTTTATTSSLPFTGADVTELAVVGAGAVLAGGLLIRRRRRTVA
jgi:LPXTG-motif cell wall-anchored protein